jgi:predicted lipoprotein
MRWTSLALATTAFVGCGGGETKRPDAPPDGFDRGAMLAHLGRNVLAPLQASFATEASALPAAIGAHCDALDTGTPGTTGEAARAAWGRTMDAWQSAEAVLVGPAAMDNRALRDKIYGWPLLASCGIDRDTVTSWADPASYVVDTRLVNLRSLAAVEYLMFNTATAHTCPTTPVGWDALGADLPRARCRQALAVATDVAVHAAALDEAWRANAGDYGSVLANAGMSGSPFSSAHEAVNVISDGLFYVDRMVKDMKLAEPAGLAVNACGTVEVPCEREAELRYADRASFAIRSNLATVRAVFTGKTATVDGPSFDDFLREVGSTELADRMTASLDGAIAAAAVLPDSFLGALTTNYADVVATHTAIKLFTDDLKSQFLTVLALEIPDDVATDND